MLRAMVKMVSVRPACGVGAGLCGPGPIYPSRVLRGSSVIITRHRDPFVIGTCILKRSFCIESSLQGLPRRQSIWSMNLDSTIKNCSTGTAFNKPNNAAGQMPHSSMPSGSWMYSGGVNLAVAKDEPGPSVTSYSARRPPGASHEISNEMLVKAIVYEAKKGFTNVLGRKKRFCEFLVEQLTAVPENDFLGLGSESQEVFQNLSLESKLYDQMEIKQRIGLLKKVAQTLGFVSLQDLIVHGTATLEASGGLQLKSTEVANEIRPSPSEVVAKGTKKNKSDDDHSPRVPLRIVPGIEYGYSEPIKLPDHVVKVASASTSELSLDDSNLSENSESALIAGRKVAGKKSLQSGPRNEKTKKSLERAAKISTQIDSEDSLSREIPEKTRSVKAFVVDSKWGLDMPISAVKCLSAPIRERLEENNFNTMRLLLQHFPRMYQNFQQAGQRVEDGQNLSFVGMIVQSRALPRGPSLGLIEVIVKSEVDDIHLDDSQVGDEDGDEETVAYEDNDTERRGRTVFLHLKRFFKGARYANPWFLNAIANKYPENAQVTVCGKLKELPRQQDHYEIREFNLELWDGVDREEPGIVSAPELLSGGKPYPVYPGKGSLQPKTIEFCIQRILPYLTAEIDPLPRGLREKLNLQELNEAYKNIHSPMHTKDADIARQRLVFDEFFYLQLGMLLPRQELADKYGAGSGLVDLSTLFRGGVLEVEKWSPLTLKLLNSLPYTLTNSQIKAASEVMWDLQRPIPMSRLLQGDVGCGKTIVACLALIEVVDAGYQGALMAPTEFLAIQHYQRFVSWFEKLEESERPTVALLTGSTPTSKARAIRSGFESGEIALAIGTHSLISDSVKFSALRLVVIDEQHRFGVSQRGRLNSKVGDFEIIGEGDGPKSLSFGAPHILAMSATPIPRTLALAMHGDMSVSQITELPPGRAETTTYAIHGDKKGRQEVYKRVREGLEDGGRVFVVFPVIEESSDIPDVRAAETEFKNLETEFKEFKVDLVHGRMRSQEKDDIMERFKSGDTQVLVSTTVIEVGIDIPEASMIVVEHAERYGMAQLHQLRGRVGRGTKASSCILLGSRVGSLERLKLLENSRDGFYLAEVDLRQRGPGDMLGKRQSGYLPEFNIARLENDGEILERARTVAEELLQIHPKLKGLPRIRQELSMRRPPASLS